MIVGTGGHARVIASLLSHASITLLAEFEPASGELRQEEVFGQPLPENTDFFIGIGDNVLRRRCFERLEALGASLGNCIAPTAWVAPGVKLGRGIFLGPGVVVNTGTQIGDNVIVNTMSSIDHDCTIGADTQITVGVTLGAHLDIGRGCYFGMKSCVLSQLTLGDEVEVMAGALVVRAAPSRVLLGGAPARVMRAAPSDPG